VDNTLCAAVKISVGKIMSENANDSSEVLRLIAAGDSKAIAEVFASHRSRLRLMVRLRLDRRLQGRLDPSDVLQEAYLDVAQRAREFATKPTMPVYLWLRFLTGQRLLQLHRHHLGTQMRDAGQEVCLYHGALPEASSVSLAQQLLGRLTSPTQAAVRAETQVRVQEALNALDPLDREVLTLRHFEMLTNEETAATLALSKSAASNRYIRALRRLKEALGHLPGWGGSTSGDPSHV
jgi:RNA polymerase sigma-70 factor, ECF subfamily